MKSYQFLTSPFISSDQNKIVIKSKIGKLCWLKFVYLAKFETEIATMLTARDVVEPRCSRWQTYALHEGSSYKYIANNANLRTQHMI